MISEIRNMNRSPWTQIPAAATIIMTLLTAVPPFVHADELVDLAQVEDRDLAETRGGYQFPSGFEISFGIERAVYIDGVLQTLTTFNIPSLTTTSLQTAQAFSALFSNGSATSAPADVARLLSALPTLVQNSLNNKTISSLTTINATVTALELFREINLSSSLADALSSSLR